ncbi:sugar phosphate nucleotidyltransferase [Neobacillus niacini]|uniref:phosphocholine cytidylyltransferase family protein n=1 Tax=Neobacillus niacini TaxID=86668 RepID=UPI0020416099|nr:phosphocholine cytidylyltransferase family protein [Neobacillus niacini]MCM3693207.1 phosphocholine cytidylyltransferase family protein [Neobacillus niacini]
MKALILAAGMGTRLRPITDDIPKSMVEVNGIPILFKQINNLVENGVQEITVVAGYKSEIIKNALGRSYPFVNVIINDEYDKTNNMYSAFLAKENFINDEFILMNADVFFDGSVITELILNKYKNSIVVEKGTYNDENMKVSSVDGKIVEISKKITQENAFGVSIDVYKFTSQGSNVFYEKIIDYIENKKDLNQWTEIALNDALKDIDFLTCPLVGNWMEIDNHDDLKRAERIFNDRN